MNELQTQLKVASRTALALVDAAEAETCERATLLMRSAINTAHRIEAARSTLRRFRKHLDEKGTLPPRKLGQERDE